MSESKIKKLESVKSLEDNFFEMINKTYEQLCAGTKEIKKEHKQIINDEKKKLLLQICQGEKLDKQAMINKYLPQEIAKLDIQPTDEDVLDSIEFNGTRYYYQPTGKCIVFDSTTKPVGVYKNGKIIFA